MDGESTKGGQNKQNWHVDEHKLCAVVKSQSITFYSATNALGIFVCKAVLEVSWKVSSSIKK